MRLALRDVRPAPARTSLLKTDLPDPGLAGRAWGDEVFRVNRFSAGFTLAYLPALALASLLFYLVRSWRVTPFDPAAADNPELYRNFASLLCSWLNPLITALTVLPPLTVAATFWASHEGW